VRCAIKTRYRHEYCTGITPNIDIPPLTIHNLAGMLVDTDNKIIARVERKEYVGNSQQRSEGGESSEGQCAFRTHL